MLSKMNFLVALVVICSALARTASADSTCPELALGASSEAQLGTSFKNSDKLLAKDERWKERRGSTIDFTFEVVTPSVKTFDPESFRTCADKLASRIAKVSVGAFLNTKYTHRDSRGRDFRCGNGRIGYKLTNGDTVKASKCEGFMMTVLEVEVEKLSATSSVSGAYDGSGIKYTFLYTLPFKVEFENISLLVDREQDDLVIDGSLVIQQNN